MNPYQKLNYIEKSLHEKKKSLFVSLSFRIRNNRNAQNENNQGTGTSCVKMRHMGHNDNISLPDSVIETSKPVKLKDLCIKIELIDF